MVSFGEFFAAISIHEIITKIITSTKIVQYVIFCDTLTVSWAVWCVTGDGGQYQRNCYRYGGGSGGGVGTSGIDSGY